jgi:hypothetical protein
MAIIPSVDEIQALEKKLPSFSEQTGVNMEESLRIPFAGLLTLTKEHPFVAAVLLSTYQLQILKHLSAQKKEEKEVERKDDQTVSSKLKGKIKVA